MGNLELPFNNSSETAGPRRLQGRIERITYNNSDNGYTVAKLKVKDHPRTVTVTGKIISPTPGEIIEARGEWRNHPRYGRQFEISEYKSLEPVSSRGIEKYLGSGLIKGIGPVMASKIVEKFGEDSLEIIENDIKRLGEIEGIGRKRIGMIKKAWDDQKEIRDVMIFLRSHDVSSGYAAKIFKRYGSRAIKIVKENPYRLAEDIFGIGFIVADRIAGKLGIPPDSLIRAEAGILYTLNRLSEEGHIYYPCSLLIEKSTELLKIDKEIIKKALQELISQKKAVKEGDAVYRAKYHFSENSVASRLKALNSFPLAFKSFNEEDALQWVQEQIEITLDPGQVRAVKSACQNKVTVITGGPGTGKTTIINAIIKIFSRINVKTLLAAPTGRAAKKMSEATGRPAKTIHRMLEYSMSKGFGRNPSRPLDCGLLILDEVSMVDMILMHHLLKALPSHAGLILVGDVNQLPSVGAGNLLGDIIDSGRVPVIELTRIFRQAEKSLIVVNAHRINRGEMPILKNKDKELSDFYVIQQSCPERVVDIIIELAKERIPARFGMDPVEDIQVLTPMHRGTAGAGNLNLQLQKALNPLRSRGGREEGQFMEGDKVMQIRNNYEKDIFNGDMGRVSRVIPGARQLTVNFQGRQILYESSDRDELISAYAVSVHKSQGSEYPAVILPVLTQHYLLLQRNLIYTAVTRAKKLVVMVGTKKALAIAIRNNKTDKRYTLLRDRLAQKD